MHNDSYMIRAPFQNNDIEYIVWIKEQGHSIAIIHLATNETEWNDLLGSPDTSHHTCPVNFPMKTIIRDQHSVENVLTRQTSKSKSIKTEATNWQNMARRLRRREF